MFFKFQGNLYTIFVILDIKFSFANIKWDLCQNTVKPLVESSVIVIFYVIFLMRYAVIINYYLFWKKNGIKRIEGIDNCFKSLILSAFNTVAPRLKSEQKKKKKKK